MTRRRSTSLEKADFALADMSSGGGILKPAQAQQFMCLIGKQSAIMQAATVVSMASPKRTLPGQVKLDAKLFKAEVRLSDGVLEDSIGRGELRQTMMAMIADAISRDMEEVLISGDTASVDPFLATMDGVLKQATSHVVDAAGAPRSKDLLRAMLKSLPAEVLRNKKALRYLTSEGSEGAAQAYSGVPVQPIPLFPENLGASCEQTAVLLCDPKNIHVGIWRQIRIESALDLSEGTLDVVATLRIDVKFARPTGVAKAINVQLLGLTHDHRHRHRHRAAR